MDKTIDCFDIRLIVLNHDDIERVVTKLSRLCAEAYVGTTEPRNPGWCDVNVHLGDDIDGEGVSEIGHAAITVRREDAPFLLDYIDRVFADRKGDSRELRERAEMTELAERELYA